MLTILFDHNSPILQDYETRYIINNYASLFNFDIYEIVDCFKGSIIGIGSHKERSIYTEGNKLDLTWNQWLQDDIEDIKTDKSELANNAYKSLEIFKLLNMDVLCTNNERLLNIKGNMLSFGKLYIISEEYILETFKSYSAGSGAFASQKFNFNRIGFNTFYVQENVRLWKHFLYFLGKQSPIQNKSIEHVRSILCHRMPFVLYSRDKIKHHSYEKFRAERQKLDYKNDIELAYYLNSHYIFLFGALDHLCVLINDVLGWGLDGRDCSIRGKKFRKQLKSKAPGLDQFLEIQSIKEWLDVITAIRHKSAHEIVKLTSDILFMTEKSELSDDTIKEILRKEDPARYNVAREVIDLSEDLWIHDWRINQCTPFSSTMIQIQTNKGYSLYDPILSVDREIEMLFATLDAFLSFIICNK
ncbi:hypothetical protein V6C53_14740 [Desulfocurvibacter africanus]|uniref:hypothetical protein n=1 Tax=Desulfocurvibacter africanus TaxID=873 RepID=UPI002FD89E34